MSVLARSRRVLLYLALTAAAAAYLVPVYVMVVTSFKPTSEVNIAQMWSLPHAWDASSYAAAWSQLSPNILNSVLISVPATVISALIGAVNGYAFSKWRFRGDQLVFGLLLFGMFIPYQSVLIPLLRVLQSVGLYNTITALILVHVIYGIPITTLMFRNWMVNIPRELVEAGWIDGAGYWSIFGRLVLPLSIPGFVVVCIWQFTSIWNEFLFAVTLTNPPNQPVMVALQNLAGSQIVEWNVQMAGAVLAATPTLLVYIMLSRWFVRGLLAGSLKA